MMVRQFIYFDKNKFANIEGTFDLFKPLHINVSILIPIGDFFLATLGVYNIALPKVGMCQLVACLPTY